MSHWSIGCPTMSVNQAMDWLNEQRAKHEGAERLPDEKSQQLRSKVMDLAETAFRAQEGEGVLVGLTSYGNISLRENGSTCVTIQLAVSAQSTSPAAKPTK